jgi:hypothetical protein
MFVEKDKRIASLVLRAGGNPPLGCQVRNVLRNLPLSHILWMAPPMEDYESPYPLKLGLFSADGVMFSSDYITDLVEKSHRGAPFRICGFWYCAYFRSKY